MLSMSKGVLKFKKAYNRDFEDVVSKVESYNIGCDNLITLLSVLSNVEKMVAKEVFNINKALMKEQP